MVSRRTSRIFVPRQRHSLREAKRGIVAVDDVNDLGTAQALGHPGNIHAERVAAEREIPARDQLVV